MKKTSIDVKCGIYNTEYTIRDYGEKICVTVPYIKWERNTGMLAFNKITITNRFRMDALRYMATYDQLWVDNSTIDDILF